jgi:hypothetical protein
MKKSQLINKGQLAEQLGRSKSYISAMCRAGFQTPCGRTSVKAAMQWMAENPDFRVADAYKRQTSPTLSRKKSGTGIRLTERA